jgi:hypothetical protein
MELSPLEMMMISIAIRRIKAWLLAIELKSNFLNLLLL